MTKMNNYGWGCRGTRTLIGCWWECKTYILENSLAVYHIPMIWSRHLTPRCLPKGNANIFQLQENFSFVGEINTMKYYLVIQSNKLPIDATTWKSLKIIMLRGKKQSAMGEAEKGITGQDYKRHKETSGSDVAFFLSICGNKAFFFFYHYWIWKMWNYLLVMKTRKQFLNYDRIISMTIVWYTVGLSGP